VKLKLASLILLTSFAIILALRHSAPVDTPEVLGWYCIDWGSDYYPQDFATIQSMHIDGVILRSFLHQYTSNPDAFSTAINMAQSTELKVGINLFHPSNELMVDAWGLPHTEDGVFLDFTTNRTWIETVYRSELTNLVNHADLDYYMFDDMAFWNVSNLTNAQRFIDLTFEITDDKAIMLAYYPPPEILPDLRIAHWDWYTPPEDVTNLNGSLTRRPLNNTSLGHFIWLYERTHISFEDLSTAYNILGQTDRLQIFSLRYGHPDWPSAINNSILEHPHLIEYIRLLNQQIKS